MRGRSLGFEFLELRVFGLGFDLWVFARVVCLRVAGRVHCFVGGDDVVFGVVVGGAEVDFFEGFFARRGGWWC